MCNIAYKLEFRFLDFYLLLIISFSKVLGVQYLLSIIKKFL